METADDFDRLADAWCTRWTARAKRWKRAAKRARENRLAAQRAADENLHEWSMCHDELRRLRAAKGATGWWLVKSNAWRSVVGMTSVVDNGGAPVGYTYSADAALAWLRDGKLPEQEG